MSICRLMSYQQKVEYLMEQIKTVATESELDALKTLVNSKADKTTVEALETLLANKLSILDVPNQINQLDFISQVIIQPNQWDSDNSYTINLSSITVPFSWTFVEIYPAIGSMYVVNKANMDAISKANLVLVEDDRTHISLVAGEKPEATISLSLKFVKAAVKAAYNNKA